MRFGLLFSAVALLVLAERAEDLPPHLVEFVAHLKQEVAATAAKYSEPKERATRILAAHVGLLSHLPISDRKTLSSFYDGNSLLEIVDPNNYRSAAVHRATSPHP